LKISSNGLSESANQRRTDNPMAKRKKSTKGQTTSYKAYI